MARAGPETLTLLRPAPTHSRGIEGSLHGAVSQFWSGSVQGRMTTSLKALVNGPRRSVPFQSHGVGDPPMRTLGIKSHRCVFSWIGLIMCFPVRLSGFSSVRAYQDRCATIRSASNAWPDCSMK